MKEFKDIAAKLKKGDIKKAAELRKKLTNDKSIQAEIIEIARQAIILHLKHGKIERALEIKKFFPISQEKMNEAIKQAVVSCYCEGDLKRMLLIKDSFPMPKALKKEIIDYCISWGVEKEELVLQAAFA